VCRRTGRPGTQLEKPPFRGPVGQWIYENISAETWNAWIGQGTKVINELRLDFSREQDQDTFDQHMHEFLGLDEELSWP
jgi:Fe-S cluster biosynthesis and repair protein YggX